MHNFTIIEIFEFENLEIFDITWRKKYHLILLIKKYNIFIL